MHFLARSRRGPTPKSGNRVPRFHYSLNATLMQFTPTIEQSNL